MKKLTVDARTESWSLKSPVRIARQTYVAMDVVVVEVSDAEGFTGRGEAPGLSYEGETMQSLLGQIDEVAPKLTPTLTTHELLSIMPRGGARNAVDCALWDLHCKRSGKRIWDLVGTSDPVPIQTALTFGISEEAEFRRSIRAARHMPLIKLKANREHHLRLAKIAREEHPDARLVIDANGSWTRDLLDQLAAPLSDYGVELIEQPVVSGKDMDLSGYAGPIPLAADESCTDRSSLNLLQGLYNFVNIKLDKTGGLTEALALANDAKKLGFGLMVGNMGGTSLSMAEHFIVAQQCCYIDLDAPLLCRNDRDYALTYRGALINPPSKKLWG